MRLITFEVCILLYEACPKYRAPRAVQVKTVRILLLDVSY